MPEPEHKRTIGAQDAAGSIPIVRRRLERAIVVIVKMCAIKLHGLTGGSCD